MPELGAIFTGRREQKCSFSFINTDAPNLRAVMKLLDVRSINASLCIDGPDFIEVIWDENYFQTPLKGYIGISHTDDAKEKIRLSKIGTTLSDEVKKRLSELKLGQLNHFYGKNHTEKVKQKIRNKKIKYIYTLRNPEGNLIKTNNLTYFCKENNLCLSVMCNIANRTGKNRTYKGWTVIDKVPLEQLSITPC